MKKNTAVYKMLGASIIIILLISSLTTIAIGTFDKKNDSEMFYCPEATTGNQYKGHLQVYIVEIESRWKMENKQHYHYALLDLAYDNDLSINYLDTYTNTINWSGDAEKNNVIVMAAAFNPEAHMNYADPPLGRPFNAHYVDAAAGATPGNTAYNTVNKDYTHTVFIEEGTASWCPACPLMASKLMGIYESGSYPFYFVAMVTDKSSDASRRMGDYSLYWVPTAFYDGGKEVVIGGDVQKSELTSLIESCGKRDVHELNLTLSVEWLGEGNLGINISITNNEALPNNPPEKPTITGSISGKAGDEYEYNITTTDPDGDNIYYYTNWGDNTSSNWTGPYGSGKKTTVTHVWNKEGTYLVKVKAKDVDGAESDWTWLKVAMPKYTHPVDMILIQILKMATRFLPQLQHILNVQ